MAQHPAQFPPALQSRCSPSVSLGRKARSASFSFAGTRLPERRKGPHADAVRPVSRHLYMQSTDVDDIRVFATAVMDIIYGIKVDNMDNEYVALMERGLLSFSESKLPGAFWVENFPFLRYLPAWMPGASAQRFGAKYKSIVMSVRERPFAVAKQDIVRHLLNETFGRRLTHNYFENSQMV